MAGFKNTNISQSMFLTVNLDEQLIPGTFKWTIDYLINQTEIRKSGYTKCAFFILQ